MPNGIGDPPAQAVAEKDARALEALLRPDIDFRAMTLRRFWEATSAAVVVHNIIFGKGFRVTDHIEASEVVGTSTIADCHRWGTDFASSIRRDRLLLNNRRISASWTVVSVGFESCVRVSENGVTRQA